MSGPPIPPFAPKGHFQSLYHISRRSRRKRWERCRNGRPRLCRSKAQHSTQTGATVAGDAEVCEQRDSSTSIIATGFSLAYGEVLRLTGWPLVDRVDGTFMANGKTWRSGPNTKQLM